LIGTCHQSGPRTTVQMIKPQSAALATAKR
jgi:hypothetical protein